MTIKNCPLKSHLQLPVVGHRITLVGQSNYNIAVLQEPGADKEKYRGRY